MPLSDAIRTAFSLLAQRTRYFDTGVEYAAWMRSDFVDGINGMANFDQTPAKQTTAAQRLCLFCASWRSLDSRKMAGKARTSYIHPLHSLRGTHSSHCTSNILRFAKFASGKRYERGGAGTACPSGSPQAPVQLPERPSEDDQQIVQTTPAVLLSAIQSLRSFARISRRNTACFSRHLHWCS